MITDKDLVYVEFNKAELDKCIEVAQYLSGHIVDRKDLHERDDLERFINVLMGEVAEQMVIKWLTSEGKSAESSVDKKAGKPDLGHDVRVYRSTGSEAFCSVKSSLSVKLDANGILNICKMATKKSELRDINIQVYFWLTTVPKDGESRVTVPSLRQAAIIGWFTKDELIQFTTYKHEAGREAPAETLRAGRSMASLLKYLK